MTGFITIWRCGCGQLERTPEPIPDRCPGHDSAPVLPWMPEPATTTDAARWGHTCGDRPGETPCPTRPEQESP